MQIKDQITTLERPKFSNYCLHNKNGEMSSETAPVRLPVIDFSKIDLNPGTSGWDTVKVQVRQAAEEFGCFEASYDKILELRKPLFGALKELFDLPLETKKLVVSKKLYRGYTGAAAPWSESMVIDNGNIAESIEKNLTKILWAQGNSSFRSEYTYN